MFYFDYIEIEKGIKTKVLKSTFLEKVEHFFTTRDFVLTCGNLEEYKQTADKNREKLSEYFHIKRQNLFIPQQTHSDNIVSNPVSSDELLETDSVISNKNGTAILLNFADCTPVIIYDERQNVGAIVHAGWRGTAASIVKKTIYKMQKDFSSIPKELVAIIGPAICQECYCVNDDVYNKIRKTVDIDDSIFVKKSQHYQNEKYYVDLKLVNKLQLGECGVQRIDTTDFCTSCNNDTFFSYRKENGITARHSAVIKISGEGKNVSN